MFVCIGFTFQLSLFYLGLERTLASCGVLISNLLPFFVLFLSHRFIPGERITMGKLWGILLGFGGVAAMFADRLTGAGSIHSGDLLILAAVSIWSANVVYTKRIINEYLPFHLVLYPMLVAAPVFILAGSVWDRAMLFDLNAVVIGAFIYQSLISAAFGFVAWSTLLKRFGASTLHSFMFIMPIAGVVSSELLFHEPITSNLIIALILIATGILLVHRSPKWSTVTFPLGRGG
jgi:drug/metabolite transporter (DMT)-like permease